MQSCLLPLRRTAFISGTTWGNLLCHESVRVKICELRLLHSIKTSWISRYITDLQLFPVYFHLSLRTGWLSLCCIAHVNWEQWIKSLVIFAKRETCFAEVVGHGDRIICVHVDDTRKYTHHKHIKPPQIPPQTKRNVHTYSLKQHAKNTHHIQIMYYFLSLFFRGIRREPRPGKAAQIVRGMEGFSQGFPIHNYRLIPSY